MSKIGKAINWTNRFVSRTITVVAVLLLLFVYFALGNAKFQKDNRFILNDTAKAVHNTEVIIMDLQEAVDNLKADNARQTLIIQCLLVVHGETQFVSSEAAQACQVIQNEAEELTPTEVE